MANGQVSSWAKWVSIAVTIFLAAGAAIYSVAGNATKLESHCVESKENFKAVKEEIKRVDETGCKPSFDVRRNLDVMKNEQRHLIEQVDKMDAKQDEMFDVLLDIRKNGSH